MKRLKNKTLLFVVSQVLISGATVLVVGESLKLGIALLMLVIGGYLCVVANDEETK